MIDGVTKRTRGRRCVSIELTSEQKQLILDSLGLHWDEVTFDAEIWPTITDDLFKMDVNLTVAVGHPCKK